MDKVPDDPPDHNRKYGKRNFKHHRKRTRKRLETRQTINKITYNVDGLGLDTAFATVDLLHSRGFDVSRIYMNL